MINKGKYINNIPQKLKECKQWLWFKIYNNKDKNGNIKTVKIPISPITCESNEWNTKGNWTDFETALEGLEKSGCDGLSFVLTEDDSFVCIDLDKVKENFEDMQDIISNFGETYVIGACTEVKNEQYKLNLYYEKYALKETIRERISYYKNYR